MREYLSDDARRFVTEEIADGLVKLPKWDLPILVARQHQKRFAILLTRSLGAFGRAGCDNHDGSVAGLDVIAKRRREEARVGVALLVAVSGKCRTDMAGNRLRQYFDPLTAVVIVTMLGKLQSPQCGINAHPDARKNIGSGIFINAEQQLTHSPRSAASDYSWDEMERLSLVAQNSEQFSTTRPRHCSLSQTTLQRRCTHFAPHTGQTISEFVGSSPTSGALNISRSFASRATICISFGRRDATAGLRWVNLKGARQSIDEFLPRVRRLLVRLSWVAITANSRETL